MPIPNNQLETWSHQGSITQSSATYASIKTALSAPDSGFANKDYEVFLQGSYGNDTNIYSESDVDIVIRLDSTFHHDLQELPHDQVESFHSALPNATYRYSEFKQAVEKTLTGYFGNDVKPGNKAIKILASGNRRNADVIVATQFRRYHRFISTTDQAFDRGICFFKPDGTRIVNYPKYHSENCTTKHQATNNKFKPLVRIMKNMRKRLVDDGTIDKALAPSYFIEGLLYNAPNDKFSSDYSESFIDCYNWILQANRTKFVTPSRQHYLIGDFQVTWPAQNCDKFLAELKTLWNNWQ